MSNVRVMTESDARAIAHDTASRQMRKACRKTWSRADYNLACETLAKLMWHVNPVLAEQIQKDNQ